MTTRVYITFPLQNIIRLTKEKCIKKKLYNSFKHKERTGFSSPYLLYGCMDITHKIYKCFLPFYAFFDWDFFLLCKKIKKKNLYSNNVLA